MPFKNQDQRAACYAKNDQKWNCNAWNAITPKNIPKHAKKKSFKEWLVENHKDFMEVSNS